MGCNHRAVFATTYRVLTQVALETVRGDRELPALPATTSTSRTRSSPTSTSPPGGRGRRGGGSPRPGRIAFEAARDGDLLASQDMLLGINAHVQNDMPFLLAALGTHTRKGHSRKVDHDGENGILERAYQRVVDTVERLYDPSLAVTNPDNSNADDIAGLELVAGWREEVWRNARRLLMTRRDPEAHAEVVRRHRDQRGGLGADDRRPAHAGLSRRARRVLPRAPRGMRRARVAAGTAVLLVVLTTALTSGAGAPAQVPQPCLGDPSAQGVEALPGPRAALRARTRRRRRGAGTDGAGDAAVEAEDARGPAPAEGPAQAPGPAPQPLLLVRAACRFPEVPAARPGLCARGLPGRTAAALPPR